MKKLVTILTLLLLTLSLSGCFGGIKLEEGQTHATFNEEGELIYIIAFEDDVLEELYDVEIDDDEDDIMDAISDSYDDNDIDMEVSKIKVEDKTAIITMVFEDFEMIYGHFYEKFEDLAEDYGDYDMLNDELEFKYFKDDDDIDEDDLDEYEDGFAILVSGGEEGAYYEFDSEIVAVSDAVDYEKISSKSIYIEDGEEGWIVIEGEVEGDLDNVPLRLRLRILEDGEASYVINGKNELMMILSMEDEDIEDNFEVDYDDSVGAMISDLEDYFDGRDHDLDIVSLEKNNNYALLTLYAEDAEELLGTFDSFEEYADWYGGLEEFIEYYDMVYFSSNQDVDEDDIENFETCFVINVNGGDEGTYYELPSRIQLVSEDMEYQRINNNTIFIEDDEYGIIVIDEY